MHPTLSTSGGLACVKLYMYKSKGHILQLATCLSVVFLWLSLLKKRLSSMYTTEFAFLAISWIKLHSVAILNSKGCVPCDSAVCCHLFLEDVFPCD
jgi:hypothetical protein